MLAFGTPVVTSRTRSASVVWSAGKPVSAIVTGSSSEAVWNRNAPNTSSQSAGNLNEKSPSWEWSVGQPTDSAVGDDCTHPLGPSDGAGVGVGVGVGVGEGTAVGADGDATAAMGLVVGESASQPAPARATASVRPMSRVRTVKTSSPAPGRATAARRTGRLRHGLAGATPNS